MSYIGGKMSSVPFPVPPPFFSPQTHAPSLASPPGSESCLVLDTGTSGLVRPGCWASVQLTVASLKAVMTSGLIPNI